MSARIRRIRSAAIVLVVAFAGVAFVVLGAPVGPAAARAPSCADYPTQAAAQAAKDTRDGDGDGIYCESNPCPCSGRSGGSHHTTPPSAAAPRRCTLTRRVLRIGLSRTRYPALLAHVTRAIAKGWPRVLRIHRAGASGRRDKLLRGIPTRRGYDRDEWPMAFARRSYRADVAYVPSGQNRSSGSRIGIKLRRYCDGQAFKIVGY